MPIDDLAAIIHEETGFPIELIDERTAIDELGVDSLEFVELMLCLKIPRDRMGEIATVGDIAKVLAN